jgi:type II secretory pathway component GspD/PulD (secretin)
VPQRPATFSLAAEKVPNTLPAGALEGIMLQVRFIAVGNELVNTLPVKWDQALHGNLRQAAGSPDTLAKHPEFKVVTMQAAAMDDAGATKILSAIMADRRSVMMSAPSAVLESGKAGKITIGEEKKYVKRFDQNTEIVAGDIAATSIQYQVEKMHTGLDMEITATFDANRGIIAELHPVLSELRGIDTFSVQPNGPFMQLPMITLTDLRTSAAIADGGTLLIVGPSIIGESEVESSVPLLSQIPGLHRLFTNRSYVKDERTLLLMVRTTKITATPAAANTPAKPAAAAL